MPSHHQSAFFEALCNLGIDLKVCYYSQLDERRLSMGWGGRALTEYEFSLTRLSELDSLLGDWRERIHIVSGIAESFHRKLVLLLIRKNIKWVHWSEGFKWRLRTLLALPIHFFYASYLINRHALGLLAIGSHAYYQFLFWGVKRHKIAILPYSTAPLVSNVAEDPQFTFLYIGSIENRKSVDVLIHAFSRLPNNLDVKLKIVGRVATEKNERPFSYYQELVNSTGSQHKVSFHPAVNFEDVADVIASANVVILPSKFDGWGVVVNEAVSLNKFVIASDKVGASETLIDNGVNGFIFDADNIESLSQCLFAAWKLAGYADRKGIVKSTFAAVLPSENAARLKMILDSFLCLSK